MQKEYFFLKDSQFLNYREAVITNSKCRLTCAQLPCGTGFSGTSFGCRAQLRCREMLSSGTRASSSPPICLKSSKKCLRSGWLQGSHLQITGVGRLAVEPRLAGRHRTRSRVRGPRGAAPRGRPAPRHRAARPVRAARRRSDSGLSMRLPFGQFAWSPRYKMQVFKG